MKHDIDRAVEHLLETAGVRRKFWHMDEKVKDLKYGIRQGDDAVIVGDTVINMEGPYPLKTGRKTGLIHTCSDVVIMGGRPLYGFNSMQVDSVKQAEEVAEDLKKQAMGLNVPMIGGNTQLENDLIPCISFTVVGKLLKDPIPDGGARIGDRVLMLGTILDGEIGERIYRANVKFNTYLELVEKGVIIHAAKDASRGGWFSNLVEMMVKAQRGVDITGIPYPRITRYMGTYMLCVPQKEVEKIVDICAKNKCPLIEFAKVTKDMRIRLGGKTVVNKRKMLELVKKTPYRKPKTTKI